MILPIFPLRSVASYVLDIVVIYRYPRYSIRSSRCLRCLCCWATRLPDTLDKHLPETKKKKTSPARPDMRSQLVLSKSKMISEIRSYFSPWKMNGWNSKIGGGWKIILIFNRMISCSMLLVGGFNPSEKHWSKWESSPNRG